MFDLRTPTYTNQADSCRNNAENTWDINYWKELIDTMARMRYSAMNFETVNGLASMISVPGYEQCALDDIWIYTGEYDDTYLGNCTNMYQPHHSDPANYRVLKKMSIDEKTKFWYDVFQYAVDRGIKVSYQCMNIYTFAEDGKYGIDDDRANATTKDYFYKGYKTLLEKFPQISKINASQSENMDYPAETINESDQWMYDVYGRAIKEVCLENPERAKNMIYGCSGLANTMLSDYFLNLVKDFPCQIEISKRYNDTHLYACTNVSDNEEYLTKILPGYKMMYRLRNEDAYHLTWGDPDFARDFCRNMKDTDLEKEKVRGFGFGIDGYHVQGKEYEFKDEELNGKYYYDRHWVNYTMFSRFAYNPDGMTNEYWYKLYKSHYKNIPDANVENAWKAMNEGAKAVPQVLQLHQPAGTDAAFLAELCWSNPTLFGFLDIKRFVNSDLADPDGDVMSIVQYVKAFESGKTSGFDKRTPLDVVARLREIDKNVKNFLELARKGFDPKTNKIFHSQLLDQECFADMAAFYADHIEAAVNLRLYNDTHDESYKTKALTLAEHSVETWTTYATLWDSRFKVERIARHGVIDPIAMIEAVKKDIKTINNWAFKTY